MNHLNEAVEKDEQGNLIEAIDLYERCLSCNEAAPLDAYLNLVLIYWQMTDFGFNASRNLDPELVRKAGERYKFLLKGAAEAYPGNAEVRFWQLYCDHVSTGTGDIENECRTLIGNHSSNNTPALYLYAKSGGSLYKSEAEDLASSCKKCQTFKNRYTLSVLQSNAINRAHGTGL